ncbi:hypothetical protein ACHAQH_000741 [Verticillium albo-atrum]
MASFYPFPRLPAELRLQIWKLAAQPRLLVVEKAADSTDFESPTPPPAVVHVCRESRNFGPYKKAFASDDSSRYAWANFDLDTIHVECLHISRPDLCQAFPERSSIKYMRAEATGDDLSWINNNCLLFSLKGFDAFSELQYLDLTVDFDFALWTGLISETYFGPKCPRLNVRIINVLSGEYLSEKTSLLYEDWYSLHMTDFEPTRTLQAGEDDHYRSELCPTHFIVPWVYSPLPVREGFERPHDPYSPPSPPELEVPWSEDVKDFIGIDSMI